MTRIVVIGGGKIGGALIGGLIDGGVDPKSIYLVQRSPERRKELRDTYGIVDADDAEQAVDGADVVFLCVKPHGTVGLLESISGALDDGETDPVVASMAAGITIDELESVCSAGTPVVRVMPNTPMMVGRGVNAIAPGRFANSEHVTQVQTLLEKVGHVEVVEEKQMDAVTAVSGSGPAYFFQFVEAMVDAGVTLGLKRDQATRLATETAAGAAEMMTREGADPVSLRADVSSPGGTTAAATSTFEEEGLRRAVLRAMRACHDKSASMGRPAGNEQ
ncbi:pyrroline-5-carboxylate reductase [uncultured Corynebacterium sp.]|uniref:pyrroline-5-carboxylate reductase n=1 Tax=uncultured Corynebacterium sp. TaxID=159447 RepID=UPI0025F2C168|nr:pyrroline-5-carboxylate reductase [uncultured Corynebacterium sp.]